MKVSLNREAARRYCDGLMSPVGQSIGAKANSLQVPANKTFKPDARIPSIEGVGLVNYFLQNYGKAAEHKRLTERWEQDLNSLPR